MSGDRIEAVEGLVKDEQIGPVGEGPGEFRPLPHTLGEGGQRATTRLGEADLLKRRVGPAAGRSRVETAQPQQIGHPFVRRRPPLGEIGSRTVADAGKRGGVVERFLAEDPHRAQRRPQLPGDQAD